MRVLIATDAWHPQVNGVVRTLTELAASARKQGAEITFLTPEGFPSVPVPTYPTLRCAMPGPRRIARRIKQARPDAIHIATEGPVGHMVRRYGTARIPPRFCRTKKGNPPRSPLRLGGGTSRIPVPHPLNKRRPNRRLRKLRLRKQWKHPPKIQLRT
jgi:hypothetical protein